MSCPHLHPDTIAECTQVAFDYHPACYCTVCWCFRDAPPAPKYLKYPSKWVEVSVWHHQPTGTPDRFVLAVAADSGPELLRNLRGALASLGPARPPAPQPPPGRPLRPAPGNGWIPTAAQTTQPLTAWPF
jgi:hypothetical protein